MANPFAWDLFVPSPPSTEFGDNFLSLPDACFDASASIDPVASPTHNLFDHTNTTATIAHRSLSQQAYHMSNPIPLHLSAPLPPVDAPATSSLLSHSAIGTSPNVSSTSQLSQHTSDRTTKNTTSFDCTDNEKLTHSNTTETFCSSFSSAHNSVPPSGKSCQDRGGGPPLEPDFPQYFPPVEALNQAISQQEGNEIRAPFHPDDRFPNQPANTLAKHLSQPQPDKDNAAPAHARNPDVPHTVEIRCSGAERLIRRNRSRGRGRNRNFDAANSRRPSRRNTNNRMENRTQSGTRARNDHSRFCHLCNTKTSTDVPHVRLCTQPGCRKSVCFRCNSEVNWPGKIADAAHFECPHCLSVCGEIENRKVQCFAYNAETERRRLQKRLRSGRSEGHLPQVQSLRVDNAADRISPPHPSGYLPRENEAVPPLAAGQCPDAAPIQNANHLDVALIGVVARQSTCPDLNLLPPQMTRAGVIASDTFLDSQPGIEQVTAHVSTTDADSGDPISTRDR